jgi:spore coat polysaccharide biosynthesis predicted glycosyltransferase SpsG
MGDLHGTWALAAQFLQRGCEVMVLAEPDAEAVTFLDAVGLRHVPAGPPAHDHALARRFRPDVLVFNMLRNEPAYVRGFRHAAALLVTVDDDGPAAALADLRLNPLYAVADALTDPALIPLKPVFQQFNRRERSWPAEVAQLLVTLGGADTHGFTPRVVTALATLPLNISVEIVLGPAFRHDDELAAALRGVPEQPFIVHRAVADLPERMAAADLAICSAGLTIFEMACVGTPAVVLCGEPFEEQTADRLARLGYGCSLGFGRNVTAEMLTRVVYDLLCNPEHRRRMGQRGRLLVDGRGAERCVAEILSHGRVPA